VAAVIRGRLAVVMPAALALVTFGAESAHGAPTAGSGVKLRVTPSSSLFDAPLTISVRGLKPKERVVLRVTSTDVNDIAWSSEATFRATDSGTVDPARVAPVSGSYSGVQAMGLIDFMSPTSPNDAGRYYFWGDAPRSFTFAATAGDRPAASMTVERSASKPGVTRGSIALEGVGFVGQLWQPARTLRRNRPCL
jgi:hypothetical protein